MNSGEKNNQRIFAIKQNRFNPPVAEVKKLIDNVIDDVKIGSNPLSELFKASPLIEKYDVIIDTQTVVIPTLLLKKVKHTVFLSATAKWFFSDFKPDNFSIKSSSLNDRLNQFIILLKNGNIKYCNEDIILDEKYHNLTNKLLHAPSRKLAFGRSHRRAKEGKGTSTVYEGRSSTQRDASNVADPRYLDASRATPER